MGYKQTLLYYLFIVKLWPYTTGQKRTIMFQTWIIRIRCNNL